MKFNTRYLIASISLLIVGAVLYYFSEIVTYILIAWIISMIGAPIVVFLRKYLGKNIAALITLGLFLIGCMVLIWTFIPPLVNQVENLSKVDYNRVVTALEEPIKDWEKWLIKKKLMIESDTTLSTQKINQSAEEIGTPIYEIKVDSVLNSENEADSKSISINIYLPENQKAQPLQDTLGSEKSGEDFFTILKSNINNYINPEKIRMMLGDSLTAFGDIMIGLFSIFFIGFFFLREQGLFDKILTSMVPSRYEQQTKQAVDETSRLLIRYFIGILIQVTIITLIVSLSLMLMGVKNALLIGLDVYKRQD